MVGNLAGFYGNLNGHQAGSKKCPLFFNEEREFEHLVARKQFDKNCRKKLESLGVRLDALETLLNVFP